MVAQNCKQKGSRNIFFFILKKVIAIWGKFSSTALLQSNVWHKKCLLLTQY